jgi:hypothetical protein
MQGAFRAAAALVRLDSIRPLSLVPTSLIAQAPECEP